MNFFFTDLIATKSKILGLVLLAPLLSWGQTATIVNYDFNSAAGYPVAPAATATGITSAATSSEPFATVTGGTTGPAAYTANTTAGSALNMTNSSGTNKYFQVTLDGASLPKYAAFKVYVQSQRSNMGAATLTLQYSLNGSNYAAFGTYAPGNGSFTEGKFDLSGVAALSAPASLAFRLVASGASGNGALRIDNFQVQAMNMVDPIINNLAPTTAEAGSPGFALAVVGSNFMNGTVVNFNGQDLATTYNSPTSLTVAVPTAAIATAGNYNVTVTTLAASSPSAPATFSVTPPLLRWTGGGTAPGSIGSWFNPANWSTNNVPGPTDDVLLDHRVITTSYTVSLDQNMAVSIKSLTVNPGAGDSIFVVVPATNTVPNALTLTNTGTGAVALAIYNKGVVTNASGATSAPGIEVIDTGPTAFIYNGGSYRQASSTTHRLVVENLSTVAGTEQGIFDFRLPGTGTRSYAISVANRTYGTLILRNSPGATPISYPAGSANSLTIQGNLLVGPGVTFTPTVGSDMRVGGDVRVQGTMQVSSSTSATSINQLVLVGTKPQTISGSISLAAGVGLVLNNPAGVVLVSPLSLNGNLTLVSGRLTTSSTNLLTLSNATNVIGGSNASFINGPLARQTAAGSLNDVVFPTGSGVVYRPVVLNASTQDATTYLVTQKEGPAADPTNFLAGTAALPTLTRVSHHRSYTLTPTPADNHFSGTITLPFGADDNVNQPSAASLTIGKNSGGAGWQNIGSSAVSVTTAATAGADAVGTITSQTFTSFSDFALASTSPDATINPLPVTLTGFGAVRQAGGMVRLRWNTASEQHSAYFEVQRSLDGSTFASIATVAARGTTSQAQDYTSLDGAAPAGQLYYRLRQVDSNGSAQYSPTATLAATVAAATLNLYPNPTCGRLVVPAAVGQQVQVLDLMGRLLHTSSLPPTGEIDVQDLPAGTYLLRTILDGQWRTFRFAKQ